MCHVCLGRCSRDPFARQAHLSSQPNSLLTQDTLTSYLYPFQGLAILPNSPKSYHQVEITQLHQMASLTDVSSLLSSISAAGASFAKQDAGAREQLLSHAYKLAAAVETPSEAIQRIGWAEVGSFIILPSLSAPSTQRLLIETSSAGKICRHANGS